MSEPDEEFLLYDANAINKLKDRNFFRQAIAQFYLNVAETHGCIVTISDRRISEAYDFWIADLERSLHLGSDEKTVELDHFKHAGFIAFWLRRLVPINDIWFIEDERVAAVAGDEAATAPSAGQIRFYRYGNELCALFVGFYLCLAVETLAMTGRMTSEDGAVTVVSDAVGVRTMPKHFNSEYPKLLKHKNVSPHGLYMLYRSLFDSLEWDVQARIKAVA